MFFSFAVKNFPTIWNLKPYSYLFSSPLDCHMYIVCSASTTRPKPSAWVSCFQLLGYSHTKLDRAVFNLMAKAIRDCFNLSAWRSLTGLEKFVSPSRSIRYENQTNRGLVTSVFPRFRFGPMCMNVEFLLAPVIFSSVLTGRCDYSRAFFLALRHSVEIYSNLLLFRKERKLLTP